MTKCTINIPTGIPSIIPMSEMKPLDIAIIKEATYENHVVFRTASIDKFEVIDLTTFKADSCWNEPNILKVQLIEAEIVVNTK